MTDLHKRILCAVICFVFLFSLCSCSLFEKSSDNDLPSSGNVTGGNNALSDNSEHYSVGEAFVVTDSPYKKIRLTNGYNALETDAQRLCYQKMATAVLSVSNEKTADGFYCVDKVVIPGVNITNSELRLVIAAFLEDNPQVFWLGSTFGYANNGSTHLQMYSLVSADELKEMILNLNEKVQEIISQIPTGSDEYERELFIHDYIIDSCEYDETVKTINDGYEAFTPYGALVNQKAVCEGYSKSFQLLLSQVGVESINVIGNGRQQLHMWNGIRLDNDWYYTDVTWDDSSEFSRYDYFNITTQQIQSDHKIAGEYSDFTDAEICGENGTPANFNTFVPNCVSSEQNYYSKTAVKLYGFGGDYDEAMIQALVDAALQGEHYISIYIDPLSLDYSLAYDELFGETGYKFFEYIDNANYRLDTSYKIDRDSVSVVKKESKSVVTVKILYI